MNNSFHHINNFFDKVFVVSLETSKDRHAWLKEQLEGLNYEMFWAVDGRKYTLDELEKKGLYNHSQYNLNRLTKGEYVRPLKLGRVGCALSHLTIYRKIVDKDYGKVLILEDDIAVLKDNLTFFNKAVGELPGDWELLYLGYFGSNNQYSNIAKMKYGIYRFLYLLNLKKYVPDIYRNTYPRPYSSYLNRAGAHFGTHAYALTRECAKKLTSYHQPVTREADNLLAELCKYEIIKAYTLKKQIFDQADELGSTILDEN